MKKSVAKKYKMYIKYHGWINYFDTHELMKGNRRSWDVDKYKKEKYILLSFEEILECIDECNDLQYNNYQFEVKPQDKFIKEFEKYKKDNLKALDRFGNIDKKNPLHHKKKEVFVEWASIQRTQFAKLGIFGEPNKTTWCYCLTTNKNGYTSNIIGYKKNKEEHLFETSNSFYHVKELKELSYMSTIDEIKKYLKSKEFKEYKKLEKQGEEELKKIDEKRINKR